MAERWFAVRCVFRLNGLPDDDETADAGLYEERITLWLAEDADQAIRKAETEAAEYAQDLAPAAYLQLAQSFDLANEPSDGNEVFSLVRESPLDADDYLDAFFDTGTERQRHIGTDE